MLHTLAEWVSRPTSRLLLIGIANTMDLSERLQQRTQSRLAVHPIVFQPYSDHNILEVTTFAFAFFQIRVESMLKCVFCACPQILVSRLQSAVPQAARDSITIVVGAAEQVNDGEAVCADGGVVPQMEPPPLFTLEALTLCAKKTANVSGDIRRALHVCHMAGKIYASTVVLSYSSVSFSSVCSPLLAHSLL